MIKILSASGRRELKENKIIRGVYKSFRNTYEWIVHYLSTLKAYVYAQKRIKNRKQGEPIKVVFLCQFPQAWEKMEALYRRLEQSKDHMPIILCVPSVVRRESWVAPQTLKNDTYEYFCDKEGYRIVNAITDDGKWESLSEFNADYVIYLRPYNNVLPYEYKSSTACKHSKVCLITYGPCMAYNDINIVLNYCFMPYVTFFFSESEDIRKINQRRFWLEHMLGIQKTVLCGMPGFEAMMDAKNDPASEWTFSENSTRIIWTPRWSTDPILGGSSFFKFKDFFLTFMKQHPDIDLLIRPHPGMFINFIKTGEMSQEEVESFRNECMRMKNVYIDEAKAYYATFWKSTLLVTDYSSVLLDYLATGKPIVYCDTQSVFKYLPYTQKLIDKCYPAHHEVELLESIMCALSNNDPMKEERVSIVKELLQPSQKAVSEVIVDYLM